MPQIVDTNSLGLTQLADYLDVDYFGLLPMKPFADIMFLLDIRIVFTIFAKEV
jgi:hypothetical protein